MQSNQVGIGIVIKLQPNGLGGRGLANDCGLAGLDHELELHLNNGPDRDPVQGEPLHFLA